ncbi:lysoplasmalogenase family protein [Vibrio sp. RC27]
MVIRFSGLSSYQGSVAKYTSLVLSGMLGLFVLLVAPLHQYSIALLAVATGIGVTILGDFLLIQRGYSKVRFIMFSIASLLYSVAFWSFTEGVMHWWLPVLLFASGIVILLLILPQVESYVFSTSLVGVLLLGLVWSTAEWWLQHHSVNALFALSGSAILFVTALTLAVRKERAVFFSRTPFVLLGYLMSQTLFSLSVLL